MHPPIPHTQSAVDAAQQSIHPYSKVGACLVTAGGGCETAACNVNPPVLADAFGAEARFGRTSGYIHAETLAITQTMQAGYATQDAAIYSTDPSCPNCMKNMIAAGISALYIDHKGFEKHYARKRMQYFEQMTLPLCDLAGVGVFKVFRKDERVETLLEPSTPSLTMTPTQHYAENSATGRVYGKILNVPDTFQREKYSWRVQPVTGLLMTAARDGKRLDPKHVTSNRIPTPRELVNFIGAGYQNLSILNDHDYRDEESQTVYQSLVDSGCLVPAQP